MRTVAKFQFSTPSDQGSPAARIVQALEGWASRKFLVDEHGTMRIRYSGLSAAFDRSDEEVADQRRHRFLVIEPVAGGSLETTVSVISRPDRTFFNCALGLTSENGISIPDVQLRSPNFVRRVMSLPHEWTLGSGGERVFPHAFTVDGGGIDTLEDLLRSNHRRLPLIVVSEADGEPLAGNLHEKLSEDLCGLAHVVRVTDSASRSLTERNGKQWSVYNGAVRLFWPFRLNNTDFRAHPLWTWDQLLARSDSEASAREAFRARLARRILEASTFISDDPAFGNFESEKTRIVLENARSAASVGDINDAELAALYAKDNDTLRSRVADLERENRDLSDNVEALTLALRTSQDITRPEETEAEVDTVSEAVERARAAFRASLAIAPETDGDVADLNPGAGPPAKVFRYLRGLSDLSIALASSRSLGKSIPSWLRERGIECSGDSETARNNKDSRDFRTRPIDGETFECEYHAKPSEGVSPDLCVRIYFTVCKVTPCVRVGYIGRHEG